MGRLANTLIPARQSGLVNIGREKLAAMAGAYRMSQRLDSFSCLLGRRL
jgi:hypothetical protein